MNWKDPKKELPKEGQTIAVVTQHWKEHNPLSCEIYFGVVQYDNQGKNPIVNNEDFTGKGSYWIYLTQDEEDEFFYNKEYALAWIDYKELQLPSWIPHDNHWKDYGR
jgi:hypothetical protein